MKPKGKRVDGRPVVKATGDPSAPLRLVKQVRFGLLSPKEILQLSATPGGIIHPQLYDNDGSPTVGGLLDPRQGVTDKSRKCVTCKGEMSSCIGHFGHIHLAEPVFHAAFLPKIVKILRCVCFYCYKLLLPPDNPHMQALLVKFKDFRDRRRFSNMYELLKGRTVCDRVKDDVERTDEGYDYVKRTKRDCGRRQPKFKQRGLEIVQEWDRKDSSDADKSIVLWPRTVLEILQNISDEECRIMGVDPEVSRPDWMVATVLCVPPITTRPSAITFGSAKNQDDLTYKLSDIVNANITLQESKDRRENQDEIYKCLAMLQLHVAHLVDNEIPGVPRSSHKSGKQLKSLKARLKGKEGRIRGNLMGKRVDYSARTVISPDPSLRLDEVGVPLIIAQNLTYPVMVTPYNLEEMRKLLCRTSYPQVKCVIKPNGDRINMQYKKHLPDISPGYQLERDLINGDLVVFNRQPTLHKMSMMGHRVKVLPHTTFRLNLSCTTPYNADFDGDEMNLHVPQSLEVVAEVEQLQLTTRQIITPQSNKPVMGIVQDSLTGAMKMTRRDVFIDRARIMDLLMHATSWNGILPPPTILKPIPLWTGKQLFSLIIPGKLNLLRTHSTHPGKEEDEGPYKWISPGDTKVLVENGELLCGILCKKTLGTSDGSILHVAMMELGHEITGTFFNDIQNVINAWLSRVGHTVGYGDAIVSDEASAEIKVIISSAKEEVHSVIKTAHLNRITAKPGKSVGETFEETINSILNRAREEAGAVAKNTMDDKNNFKIMACAGSKGSDINIAQIAACVGQQNVEGKRINFGYGERTLPTFTQFDNGPESRGFVEHSFFTGLNPAEYFFHAMAGREGLIDTAVKTAETGYIQRRLMKAMESIMASYDGTVRNSMSNLVQFCYGEDGLAGEKVEFQKIPSMAPTLSDDSFEKLFKCDLRKDADENEAIEHEWDQLKKDREQLRKILPIDTDTVALPCNLERQIWNIKKAFQITRDTKSDLTAIDVVAGIDGLLKNCRIFQGEDNLTKLANENATFLFQCLVRSSLCSKRVIDELKLTSVAFDQLIKDVERNFQRAIVEPGEMVGALAAQSIGEPATQMTLNTFHYAGISSKNVTLGVPRLKEIINISKNPKNPSTTVFLTREACQDENKAKELMTRIVNTPLKSVLKMTSISYDPDMRNSVVKADQRFLDSYLELGKVNVSNVSPWVYRLVLDQRKVADKKLTQREIIHKIKEYFGGTALVMGSDDNAENLVIRIYPKKNQPGGRGPKSKIHGGENDLDDQYLRCIESSFLSDLSLKGIKSIWKVFMSRPTNDPSMMRTIVKETGDVEHISEWVLETEGTALLEILAQKYVDHKRTISDDIWEMYCVLGVEAARRILQIELRKVLDFYGLYVNYRHISLLCDTMTSKGYLMPITRHGINRQETGPLMRCSFEETADVLIEAAVHSERDLIRGVSENVIVGQIPRMGTGAFDIILDEAKCALAKEIPSHMAPAALCPNRKNPSKIIPWTAQQQQQQAKEGKEGEGPMYTPESPPFGASYTPVTAVNYNPVSPEYYPTDIPMPSYNPRSPDYSPAAFSTTCVSPDYSPSPSTSSSSTTATATASSLSSSTSYLVVPKSPEYYTPTAAASLSSSSTTSLPSTSALVSGSLFSPDYNPTPAGTSSSSPTYKPPVSFYTSSVTTGNNPGSTTTTLMKAKGNKTQDEESSAKPDYNPTAPVLGKEGYNPFKRI